MFHRGEGVAKDVGLAVEWYCRAAKQGDAPAQSALGKIYYEGEGVPRNVALAAEWYRKAADQGLADAQRALGRMYRRGEGVPKDDALAAAWLRKAEQTTRLPIKPCPVPYEGRGTRNWLRQ